MTRKKLALTEPICLGYIPKNYLPNEQPNHGEYGQIEILEIYITKFNIISKTVPFKTVSTTYELNFYRSKRKRQFTIKTPEEIISLRVENSVTIEAVKIWVKTWSPKDSVLITPSNKTIHLDKHINPREVEYIYFIHNEDSKAIKIGRAKNVEKRLKSLQTASPAILKILGVKCVEARRPPYTEGNDFHDEQIIHCKFAHLKISGEWFKAEKELLEYIEKECMDFRI